MFKNNRFTLPASLSGPAVRNLAMRKYNSAIQTKQIKMNWIESNICKIH